MAELTKAPEIWIDHLRHMLGATDATPKSHHGYRNFFCASIGSEHWNDMRLMEAHCLVTDGAIINNGRDQYFHATLAGCKAAGLSKAAIKRAMED